MFGFRLVSVVVFWEEKGRVIIFELVRRDVFGL